MKQWLFITLIVAALSTNVDAQGLLGGLTRSGEKKTTTSKGKKFQKENSYGNIIKYCVLSDTEKTVAVTGGRAKLENLVIPDYVEFEGTKYSVTEISSSAFFNNHRIAHVTFPNTLKIIKTKAFCLCKGIKTLSFPEGLTEIEEKAFHTCSSLQTISIPNSIKTIGAWAFSKFYITGGLFTDLGCSADDYNLENIPAFINEFNCERMGISKGSVAAYLAQHPRDNQKQVIYVQAPVQNAQTATQPAEKAQRKAPSSDVDVDIPSVSDVNENVFAVIFANENYQEEVNVEYALNDGETMKQYCNKILGIPEDNIHFRKDATRNNMIAEMSWLEKVAKAYKGEARFIIYYAGHGIPDEKSGTSYLLPVDGKGNMLETGYSLQQFYKQLGTMPSAGITVFMDACFSGSKRGDGMLASARGVAIKAKAQAPQGKMIVFSAAQGDETAYPFKEKEHGLFTYYLLKKLKDTKGNVSMSELGTYITEQVSRKSLVANGKSQTPSVSTSTAMGGNWMTLKIK